MIFHIVKSDDWEAAKVQGVYTPASLAAEGFIHCSSIGQVVETANLFYQGQRDLILLCIDQDKLTAPLRFEAPAGPVARASRDFPHIYGALNLDSVVSAIDFPCKINGSFALPASVRKL